MSIISGFTKPMDNYFTCKIMTYSVCTMFSSDSEITNIAGEDNSLHVTDLASPATLSIC